MLHIITSIQDSANYIKLEDNGNLILTPDIKEATKFTDSSYELTKLIKRVRETFPYQFIVVPVNERLFGTKPRNLH